MLGPVEMSVWLEHSEAIATLASVMAAIMIGFVEFRQNQRRMRREYTLGIMLQRLSNPDLAKAMLLVADRVARGEKYPRQPEGHEEHRLVVMLLSYYEFVAVAYHRNDLERV